ncbi:hypothetical protein [Bacillus thuringiensis]|uniref:hypothetical protein n=1 Tax=Bacillus thuringiensis TaxID=1428 RepID=UPI000BFC8BEA|nr:hypothetical protein [Bacillus thuringiensis]PGT89911.1 hypothetical protein COD17_09175 [Bacillus thuringiensis]
MVINARKKAFKFLLRGLLIATVLPVFGYFLDKALGIEFQYVRLWLLGFALWLMGERKQFFEILDGLRGKTDKTESK